MKKIIYADELMSAIRDDLDINGRNFAIMKRHIDNAKAADAVSRGVFDQVMWERNVAIGQLEELRLSLGQKIEGVYLTKEDYEKLLEYKYMYEDLCK